MRVLSLAVVAMLSMLAGCAHEMEIREDAKEIYCLGFCWVIDNQQSGASVVESPRESDIPR